MLSILAFCLCCAFEALALVPGIDVDLPGEIDWLWQAAKMRLHQAEDEEAHDDEDSKVA